MFRNALRTLGLGIALMLLAFGPPGWTPTASAGTGPGLELLPWPENASAVFTQTATVYGDTHTKGNNDHFQMTSVNLDGRYRLSNAAATPPLTVSSLALGYEAQYFNINTTAPTIPQHLIDVSVAAGEVLYDSARWRISFVGGAEYSGSSVGGDPDAYYGRADLLGQYHIDKDRELIVGLDYYGNRLFLPDVPLPIIAYNWRLNRRLEIFAGVPYLGVEWKPEPRLQMRFFYEIPYSGSAIFKYRLFDHFKLLADYADDENVFHVSGTPNTQRLFFSQQRVEAGLSWRPMRAIRLELTGGYAFGQEFQSGFDVRKLNTLSEIAPEPYARIEIAFGF
jgi:hypothetical protein